jgi:trimethylamine--corrinoid protein Co-methyltransferase
LNSFRKRGGGWSLVTQQGDNDTALDALREVPPGGHFFGAGHTRERYLTAFYEPLVADWSNFGTWTGAGQRQPTSAPRKFGNAYRTASQQ